MRKGREFSRLFCWFPVHSGLCYQIKTVKNPGVKRIQDLTHFPFSCPRVFTDWIFPIAKNNDINDIN